MSFEILENMLSELKRNCVPDMKNLPAVDVSLISCFVDSDDLKLIPLVLLSVFDAEDFCSVLNKGSRIYWKLWVRNAFQYLICKNFMVKLLHNHLEYILNPSQWEYLKISLVKAHTKRKIHLKNQIINVHPKRKARGFVCNVWKKLNRDILRPVLPNTKIKPCKIDVFLHWYKNSQI